MHIIKLILFKLIYKKYLTYFIKLYKSYKIIKYINNNYLSNFKDWKLIINYYFFINKTIIILNSKK